MKDPDFVESLVFDATSLASVGLVKSFLREKLAPLVEDEKRLFQIILAVEEVVVNIVKHGKPKKPEAVVEIGVCDGGVLVRTVDYGVFFNPLEADEPQVDEGIEDRKVGGLGIFLVRRLADGVDYRRVGDVNCLSLFFKLS